MGLFDNLFKNAAQRNFEAKQYNKDLEELESLQHRRAMGDAMAPHFDAMRAQQSPEQGVQTSAIQEMLKHAGLYDQGVKSLGDLSKQRTGLWTGQDKRTDELARPKPTARQTNLGIRGPGGNWIGYADMTPEQRRLSQEYDEAKSTKISLGDDQRAARGTPQDNKDYGFASDTPTYWDKGVLKPVRKMSPEQGKVQAHQRAMSISSRLIDDLALEHPDFNPGNTKDWMLEQLSQGSTVGKLFKHQFQSPVAKKYFTSAMNWVSANRAYISGAAVPEVEVQRDLETYFATPNDSPELAQMKRQLRRDRQDVLAKQSAMSGEEREQYLRQTADQDYLSIQAFKRQKDTSPIVGKDGWEEGPGGLKFRKTGE